MIEGAVRTLRGTAAARILRAEILSLATDVARHPSGTGTIRLLHPRMSERRIEEEWRAAARVLRSPVLGRLSLQAVFADGRSRVFGKAPVAALDHASGENTSASGTVRLPPRDLSFAVEKVLVWAWLTRKGPLTRKWLEHATGCSYPTVASALKRLGGAVRRHSDRRIELSHLPREEWARLFALSRSARSTMRFADRSGQPESAARLLRRLGAQLPSGVAVGGVPGARHHLPDLDIVGIPRLDLSVHAPGREVDLGFVTRLDPALAPVEDWSAPAQLVVHFVRHADPLYSARPGALPWADCVECLLDLDEAGLHAQAVELMEALTPRETAR